MKPTRDAGAAALAAPIASRDNPLYKALRRSLGDAAARREAGIAILEGIHLCDAFFRSGGLPRRLVVGRSALDDAEVVALIGRAREVRVDVSCVVLDDALYGSLSQVAHGVALLTIVDVPAPARPDRLTATSVLLDRVQDAGNVGSILRSAAAAGIGDVYLSRACAGAWSPKVLRAAMGAHFHLRLFEDCDLAALRDGTTVRWLATSPHAQATVYDTDLRGDVAWLFGHEGQGLSSALTDGAEPVRIPQPGHGESLNVAASAAICFFEQVRQRLAASSVSTR